MLLSVRQRTGGVSPADSSVGLGKETIRRILFFFNKLGDMAYILLFLEQRLG